MNILVISEYWPTSANPISGIFVLEQVREYKRQGHSVKVIAPLYHSHFQPGRRQPVGTSEFEVYAPRIPIPPGIVRLPQSISARLFVRSLRAWAAVVDRVVEEDIKRGWIEAVHINGLSFGGLSLSLIPALNRVKKIVTVHGEDPLLTRIANTTELGRVVSQAAGSIDILALCGSTLFSYLKVIGVSCDHVVVVPNGTHIPRCEARAVDEVVPHIVSIANLQENKNIATVMRALASIRDRHNFRCTIVGDGDQRKSLERLVDRLGIRGCVEFVGRIEHQQTLKILEGANVFCLPSKKEAFGIVFLEAMARRVPVIGSRGTGAADIFSDGVEGFLVDSEDVSQVSEAISALLADPERSRAMGNSGYMRAQSFSWSANVSRYSKLFSDSAI